MWDAVGWCFFHCLFASDRLQSQPMSVAVACHLSSKMIFPPFFLECLVNGSECSARKGELLLFSHFCRTNHQMETLSLMYMPACRCIIVLRECLRKARSCSCTVNSTYLVWNQNLATCIPNFLQLGLDLSLASFIRPSFWDVWRVSTPRMPVHTLAA